MRKVCREQGRLGTGPKRETCSLVDASRNVLRTCKRKGGSVRKCVSGRQLVRAPGGLLERLQRGVALEALGESGSSFWADAVVSQTASTGEKAGVG